MQVFREAVQHATGGKFKLTRADLKATLNRRLSRYPWETMEHLTKDGSAKLIEEDLSSPEIKRNDPYPMRFSFEEAIETTPPKEE